MATIKQYQTGEAGRFEKAAVDQLQASVEPVASTKQGRQLIRVAAEAEPRLLSQAAAEHLIEGASACAVGDRICYGDHADVPRTQAVFLDELAMGLAAVDRAVLVSKQEAKAILARYRSSPIIGSKVSGRAVEICRTHPQTCLYWTLEKRGVKCIARCK